MHAQFAGGLALVAVVLLKDSLKKALLEFADSFGIENATTVHLHNQRFQLVLHDSLAFIFQKPWVLVRLLMLLLYVAQRRHPCSELLANRAGCEPACATADHQKVRR